MTTSVETPVGKPSKLSVVIICNGVARSFEAPSTATVQSLLSRAMGEFGISGQDYVLATEANPQGELDPRSSLTDAGIVDNQRLVLRPRIVRSGAES